MFMKGFTDTGCGDRWTVLSYDDVAEELDAQREAMLQKCFDESDIPDDSCEFNKYELMGWSHEASLILLASEEIGRVWEELAYTLARAFALIIDFTGDMFDELYCCEDKKHFDGVYYKPKMLEYYKTQPNVINLNHKIRKARNLI